MRATFIATVFNEKNTIGGFLKSIFNQTLMPDEIIIVDGGSTDSTLSTISNFQFPISKNNVKIISKKGNRSIGRNEAIKNATGEVILCSDAGCILDKDWVRSICEPFENPKVDVVAGYYKGKTKTVFEKCLVPYVLIMPNRVSDNNFLPASRSMAFRKKTWEKIGGFSEQFSNNEDYVFARNLKTIKANIFFERNAVVYWIPRGDIKEAFIMFYRFAKGDAESRIFRPKVTLIFLRYLAGIIFLFCFLVFKSYLLLNVLYLVTLLYISWSIAKNYKYVKNWRAMFYLPLIQLVSDIAVILGTIIGAYRLVVYEKRINHETY